MIFKIVHITISFELRASIYVRIDIIQYVATITLPCINKRYDASNCVFLDLRTIYASIRLITVIQFDPGGEASSTSCDIQERITHEIRP